MGNCWGRIAAAESKPASAPAPAPSPSPGPDRSAVSIPEPDPIPSSVAHLIDDDGSFVGVTSWFSMVSANFSTWMSQASGAISSIRGGDQDSSYDFVAPRDKEGKPLKAFTFEELKASTFNFKTGMMLGKGGFGNVYKGWLKENFDSQSIRTRAIAVKKLNSNSKQGFRQWQTEVSFLAKLSHPNIVKLIGYCRENEELLIVYEFMEKGSLNYHLFGNRLLPWNTRLNIAIGMAEGLSYLHTMEKPIIFRDFKSSNVLLDKCYAPKISDFGLAKWGPQDGMLFVRANVVGTLGYSAPEYVGTGDLNVKSDVYSFGVVLVEMLTGLRAIDKKRSFGQQELVRWARLNLSEKHKLKSIMDPKLEGKYAIEQAFQTAILAVRCIDNNNIRRPSMKEVADRLNEIKV